MCWIYLIYMLETTLILIQKQLANGWYNTFKIAQSVVRA